MDFGATISRAFKRVRQNRVLWLLGFLAALGGAANAFGNGSRTSWRMDARDFPTGMRGFPMPGIPMQMPNWMLRPGVMAAGLGALIAFVFVLGLAFYVIGLIARGGLIKGVQLIEAEGKTAFKPAWSAGVAKFWSLLGLTLLLFLPFIVIGVIALITLVTSGVAMFAPMMGGNAMPQNGIIAGGIVIALLVLTIGCAATVYGLIALGLQTLGERAILLDNLSVMDALRKAWALLKAQLGNIILLALIVFLIDLAVSLVTGLILAVLFIPTAVTMMGAAQTIQTSTLVLGGIGFIAAVLVSAVIGSVFTAFNSAVWTLAYQQFTRSIAMTPANTDAPLTHLVSD
jgi:hypothetical protein